MPDPLTLSDDVRASFQPIMAVLPSVRQELVAVSDVVTVRPGYRYPPSGDPVASVVIAVVPGATPVDAASLEAQFGVPCTAVDASIDEQLAHADEMPVAFGVEEDSTVGALERMLGEGIVEFRPPKTGTYEPLDPPDLPLVDEEMALTICVSPEAGWSELETFLAATRKRLTVAMYQFTAPHIFEAVRSAVAPAGRTLELVMHPYHESPPEHGVKADDLVTETEVLKPLSDTLGDRFQFAKATLITEAHPEGLWASSYHIKVAVRDGKAGWLSSGNWQSSNQPDVHLFGDDADPQAPLPEGFPNDFNREYHAVFENKTLAKIFEKYIKRDFELSSAQAGTPVDFSEVELFVPQTAELPVDFGEGGSFFEPLRLDRKIKVQPLLTPDNYAENVLELIESAEESLWFQNQYIKLRGTGEDFPELTKLVGALKGKIDQGIDVRIICRDLMSQADLDVLIAEKFPRNVFRFQEGCHNKTIIVDKKVAMVGSHNWSNEGVATNRDASLIFHDQEIAEYLAEVYDDDWRFRANDKPQAVKARVARPDEPTPPGFVRVPMSSLLDD